MLYQYKIIWASQVMQAQAEGKKKPEMCIILQDLEYSYLVFQKWI